jgi:hypothetical protein
MSVVLRKLKNMRVHWEEQHVGTLWVSTCNTFFKNEVIWYILHLFWVKTVSNLKDILNMSHKCNLIRRHIFLLLVQPDLWADRLDAPVGFCAFRTSST